MVVPCFFVATIDFGGSNWLDLTGSQGVIPPSSALLTEEGNQIAIFVSPC
jgi:hypothetical protein